MSYLYIICLIALLVNPICRFFSYFIIRLQYICIKYCVNGLQSFPKQNLIRLYKTPMSKLFHCQSYSILGVFFITFILVYFSIPNFPVFNQILTLFVQITSFCTNIYVEIIQISFYKKGQFILNSAQK